MKCYDVDPDKLNQVFDTKTSTYKFYWMLSLLDEVQSGHVLMPIPFYKMVAHMLGKAWIPLTTKTLEFGKCDAMIKRVNELIIHSQLSMDDIEERVTSYICENATQPMVKQVVTQLTKYVPYRFLSPWIGNLDNKQSAAASQDFEKYRCPYAIIGKSIKVNPEWAGYLTDHCAILEHSTKYRLLTYLTNFNSNIIMPDAEDAAMTSDAYSTSVNSQFGLASEPQPNYGNNSENKLLKKQLKEQQSTICMMNKSINTLLSLVIPNALTLNNYGTIAGEVSNLAQMTLTPQK